MNSIQTEVLYQKIIDLGKFSENDSVIDAYCGIGSIGIALADKVKKVFGVEVVDVAIEDAKVNQKLNNLTNMEFICNKAEDQIVKWCESGIKVDAIVVDHPRKGCEEILLSTIVKMAIPKVIYVSCDTSTIARDCRYLVDHDYTLTAIQSVDMFPQTNHVETIVVLFRKNE